MIKDTRRGKGIKNEGIFIKTMNRELDLESQGKLSSTKNNKREEKVEIKFDYVF